MVNSQQYFGPARVEIGVQTRLRDRSQLPVDSDLDVRLARLLDEALSRRGSDLSLLRAIAVCLDRAPVAMLAQFEDEARIRHRLADLQDWHLVDFCKTPDAGMHALLRRRVVVGLEHSAHDQLNARIIEWMVAQPIPE